MIIAIDGPAASGKGTLARGLAMALDYAHLDSGLFYRLYPDMHGRFKSADDYGKAIELVDSFKLANLDSVRDEYHANRAALFAENKETRSIVNKALKIYAEEAEKNKGGIVVDGRDIGTLAFPGAGIKLFVTASIDSRARRRHKELIGKGIDTSLIEVTSDIKGRDLRDQTRDLAPLISADDAILLDTTALDSDETLNFALSIVQKRIEAAKKKVE